MYLPFWNSKLVTVLLALSCVYIRANMSERIRRIQYNVITSNVYKSGRVLRFYTV